MTLINNSEIVTLCYDSFAKGKTKMTKVQFSEWLHNEIQDIKYGKLK